jgi:DNA-binding CsgD family transcriptional regulator
MITPSYVIIWHQAHALEQKASLARYLLLIGPVRWEGEMTATSPSTAAPYAREAAIAVVRLYAHRHALSGREGAVLILGVAWGLHRKECAYRLGCSSGTVDTYWRRIFKKTGTRSQSEISAAILAYAVE